MAQRAGAIDTAAVIVREAIDMALLRSNPDFLTDVVQLACEAIEERPVT